MPFVQITWSEGLRRWSLLHISASLRLPKACRNAATRQAVADAVIKAICSVKGSETSPANVVVRELRRPRRRARARAPRASARLRRIRRRVPAAQGLLGARPAPDATSVVAQSLRCRRTRTCRATRARPPTSASVPTIRSSRRRERRAAAAPSREESTSKTQGGQTAGAGGACRKGGGGGGVSSNPPTA